MATKRNLPGGFLKRPEVWAFVSVSPAGSAQHCRDLGDCHFFSPPDSIEQHVALLNETRDIYIYVLTGLLFEKLIS